MAAKMNLPDDFIRSMKQLIGDNSCAKLSASLAEEPPVSIRLNPFKCPTNIDIPLKEDSISWCDTGLYLTKRPNFTFDPLLHTGLYYVQEASSMFVSHVLKQYITTPIRMLDLCAAPGGKSTTALSVLPVDSLLYCNEPIHSRAQILKENIIKFGQSNVIVTNNLPRDYRKTDIKFDVILTDVPCSGEGMFRKDEGAINEWSLANVEHCRKLQREIISDIWDCLNPGGLLIYSTCTFNTKENEENVSWISSELGADVILVNIDDSWDITGSLLPSFDKPVYRFLPYKTKGEGLFMAVLRKHGESQPYTNISSKANKNNNRLSTSTLNKDWIKYSEQYDFIQNNTSIVAIHKHWTNEYNVANRQLRVIHAGIEIGEVKGKGIIPAQSLALSAALNPDKFPKSELPYTQAIQYLRKDTITLDPNTSTGLVLLTYKGVPLGFGKNIGNRVNNLYPTEWKIKSTHIPGENNEVITIKQQ